jgi:hypothetical protein
MDVERRAYYDAIAGFQVGGVNPFDDASYERDMVRQAARTPAIQPAPLPLPWKPDNAPATAWPFPSLSFFALHPPK